MTSLEPQRQPLSPVVLVLPNGINETGDSYFPELGNRKVRFAGRFVNLLAALAGEWDRQRESEPDNRGWLRGYRIQQAIDNLLRQHGKPRCAKGHATGYARLLEKEIKKAFGAEAPPLIQRETGMGGRGLRLVRELIIDNREL